MSVFMPTFTSSPDVRPRPVHDSEAVSATVERRRELLEQAVRAIHDRGYFSAFPESPSPRVYGEAAAAEGWQAFEAS